MAYFKCGSGGSSVEIDGVEVDRDLKLVSSCQPIYLTDLPDSPRQKSGFILDGKIHVLIGGSVYKYQDNKWVLVSEVTDDTYQLAVAYKGDIYLLLGASDYKKMTKYNGETWTNYTNIPAQFSGSGDAVADDNYIYIMGGPHAATKCYRYNGSTWSKMAEIPYNFYDSTACIKDGLLNLLGTSASNNLYNHYVLNANNTWTSVSTLPYNFRNGGCVLIDNEFHIFGQYHLSTAFLHYSMDNDTATWTKQKNLPIPFKDGAYVAYDNCIWLLGSKTQVYVTNSSSSNALDLYLRTAMIVDKTMYDIEKQKGSK